MKVINYLSFMIVILFSSYLFAAKPMDMTVDKQQKHFVVVLPANPTTGYNWVVKSYDKTLLDLIKSSYQRPKSKLMGAGGKMIFTFALKNGKSYPKQTKMLFNYNRNWEKSGGENQVVTIRFINLEKAS